MAEATIKFTWGRNNGQFHTLVILLLLLSYWHTVARLGIKYIWHIPRIAYMLHLHHVIT